MRKKSTKQMKAKRAHELRLLARLQKEVNSLQSKYERVRHERDVARQAQATAEQAASQQGRLLNDEIRFKIAPAAKQLIFTLQHLIRFTGGASE